MNLDKPDRDLNKLQNNFKQKVELFLADERIKDKIFVTEAYRSQERQNYLYAQGRKRPGAIVTWTTSSNHTKGNSIDIAFKGDELYPSEFKKWREIADIAMEYEIDWGYDLWKTDRPHFQDNGKTLKIHPETSPENVSNNKYEHILRNEIKNGYEQIFNEISGNDNLTEEEIKTLMEIGFARLEKRILKKIKN